MKEKMTKAAAYLRLSREDGDGAESNSITNQRGIIRDFAQSRGFTIAKEYADDGFTGSNFDRPGFKALLQDIREGEINCVIVKDLSRFGRNLTESGRYLEQLFPVWGVRFIAIHDFYDSAKNDSAADTLTVAFKGLLNEMYCRDISQKVKATLDMKRRNGEYIGSVAPYGYRKAPENHNKLLIHEPTANIVRMIFELKIEGMNQRRIADWLNSLGAPTPAQHMEEQGKPCALRKKEDYFWHPYAVTKILKDEIYMGTMVQGRQRKLTYKKGGLVPVPKENWIRVEGAVPAIVERREFEYVQDLNARDTGTAAGESHVYLFSGFLRCGDCGQNMTRHKITQNGRTSIFYFCSEHTLRRTCSYHRIKEDSLVSAVSAALHQQIEFLFLAGERLKEGQTIPAGRLAMTSLDGQIAEASEEIRLCQQGKSQAYEDLVAGVLDRDGFRDMAGMFDRRIQKAADEIRHLETEKQKLIDGRHRLIPWIESLKQYRGFTELTRKMLVAMVEDIFVYEGGKIKVMFRYADQIADLLRMALEEGEKIELPRKNRKAEILIDSPLAPVSIRQPMLPAVIPFWRDTPSAADIAEQNGVEVRVAVG